MQLPLNRNTSLVHSVDVVEAPKGCLLDSGLNAFFNAGGSANSNYSGLLSICSVRAQRGK